MSARIVTVTVPAFPVKVTITDTTAKVNGVEKTIPAWRSIARQASPFEADLALARAVVRAVDGETDDDVLAVSLAMIDGAFSLLRRERT